MSKYFLWQRRALPVLSVVLMITACIPPRDYDMAQCGLSLLILHYVAKEDRE